MKPRKLRFGVLGVGRIGKIHIENLVNRIPGAEVAALSDVAAAELEAVATRFGIERTFGDYRGLLDLPEVDAVAICSPTNLHYQMIVDAAARGKQIFCEKPIDLSIEKVQAAIEEVGRRGVQMMVGFNRRFDPNFLKVRETIAGGLVGQPHVLRITSRDPAPPPEPYIRASGGLFLDMTIHDFDMARYLMGSEVTEVYARAAVLVDPVFATAGDWDTAVITLTFENGAYAVIDNSRKAVYGYDQRVEMFGSEGMVTVTNNTPDTHILCDGVGIHTALPLNFFLERYAESYLREMRAFVDAVENRTPVPVGGGDGLKAALMALAARKSALENRPVKLAEIYQGVTPACPVS
ncbi:MAG: inositol 2-dehydrogenase [Acidobacteriia bacterium]|nr:inositol 2-dehydrogenase [Terriglobia bacterium]